MRHHAVHLLATTLAGAMLVAFVASLSAIGAGIIAVPVLVAVGLEASIARGGDARTHRVDMRAAARGGFAPVTRGGSTIVARSAEVHDLAAFRAAKGPSPVEDAHDDGHLAPVIALVPRERVRDDRMRAHG